MRVDKDVLSNSIKEFLDYRRKNPSCMTRGQYPKYCGKGFYIDKVNKRAYCFGMDNVPFRVVGFSNAIVPKLPKGWYIDNYEREIALGIVFKLPSRKGKELFLAGYVLRESDCILDVSRTFDESSEASYYADSMAEQYAEQSREYEAKYQAEQDIEQLHEDIKEYSRNIRKIIQEFKKLVKVSSLDMSQYPTLRDSICKQIKLLLRLRQECFNRITVLENNFWEAVQ